MKDNFISYVDLSKQWKQERKDLLNLLDKTLSEGMYVGGQQVSKLEKNIAKFLNVKYVVSLNSGTDALTLALHCLGLKKNDEVITPPNSFIASTAVITHLGLKPRFVDVLDDQNIDPSQIEKNITKKTKAIMPVHLTGRICRMKDILKIAKKYNLKVIEDSADTIGYTIDKKDAGKYSNVTTNSFYASHIINGAGTGGIACFNDYKLYQRAKLLRGWGRSSATFNESESINKRFNVKISGIDYDAKYIFSDLGYNFLPSEISAAFALEQIKKLKKNISIRNKNFDYLKDFFSKYKSFLKLPEQNNGVKTPWLAFPLVIKKNKFFNRKKLQIFFEKNNIQTRTIFTGNILKQPVMKNKIYKKHKNCNEVANDVMKNGILLGCHQGMSKSDLKYITNTFKKFLKYENIKN